MAFNPNSVRVQYEPLRSLAFGGISGAYAAVGTAFANSVRIIKITNLTDADLYISYDGVTNNDIIPAKSSGVLDYCSDRSSQGGYFEQAQNTTVYVKQVSGAATLGSVYITVIYAANA